MALKTALHKICLLLIPLLMLFSAGYTQEGKILLIEASRLTAKDLYDSSISVMLKYQNSQTEKISLDFIESYRLLGENYMNLAQYKKADSVYQKGLSLLKNQSFSSDSILGKFYHSIGRNLGSQNKYDESLAYELKALKIRKQIYGPSHNSIAECYNMMSYSLRLKGQYDSALNLSKLAIEILNSTSNEFSREISRSYYDIGWIYAAKGMYNKSLENCQKSLDIRVQLLGKNHLLSGNSYSILAFIQKAMGYTEEALENQLNVLALRTEKLGSKHVNVASSYQDIGQSYYNLGAYQQSIDYYVEGNKIWIELYGDKDRNLVRFYNQLAQSYKANNNYEQFKFYLNQAVKVAEEALEPNHPELVSTYRSLASFHKNQNDFHTQFKVLNKALEVTKISFGKDHSNIGLITGELAEHALLTGDLEKALKLQSEALKQLIDHLGPEHPLVAKNRTRLGDILLHSKQYDKAITEYENVLKGMPQSTKQPQYQNIPNKPLILKVLRKIANLYRELYSLNIKDLTPLKKALEHYQSAIALTAEIRKSFSLPEDQQSIFEEVIGIYEEAQLVTLKLYDNTREKHLLEKSFELNEKSKSFKLSQHLQERAAIQYSNIPDSLLNVEKQLKIEKTFYQNRLAKAKLIADHDKINLYETEYFKRKNQYNVFIQHLSDKYPSYHELKYRSRNFSLEKIQKEVIGEKEIFIEYFVGKENIFIQAITKEDILILKTNEIDTISSLIDQYKMATTNFEFITNNAHSSDKAFVNAAYQLFSHLLYPIMSWIPADIKDITIVPDGKLHQINFESLLLKNVDDFPINYKNLPYVLRDYQVKYAYSLDILSLQKKKKEKNIISNIGYFGGFAPEYTAITKTNLSTSHNMYSKMVRNGRLPLPGAVQEVQSITGITHGKAWIGNDATEENFKNNADRYTIVHLATHSLIDNKNPLLSELVFNLSNDSINDGFLNIAEIYNLQLNADLAILSACETGYGPIEKGEGNMSIARAFSYAGCHNIIMSLWKVPDQSTKSVMLNLYNYLLDEMPKGQSLNEAKLQYINSVEDPLYAHPYYWAGFILMGDNNPIISPDRPLSKIYLFTGILVLVLLVIFLYKKIAP